MIQPTFLITAVIIGLAFIVGQYVVSDPVRNADRTITVQATGTSKDVPNIAHITLGVQIQQQATAAIATDMLGKKVNSVLAVVRGMGIEDKDIMTQNIAVNPSYDFQNGSQVPRGFDASQQVVVTVRKADTVGEIVAKATAAGANQIGGVQFTTDSPEVVQLSAEKDAIANATKKAEQLADSLNVRLGKVKTYSAQGNVGGPMYAMEAQALGKDMAVTAPEVPVGTQETSVTVSVTYEIR